jgi:glycerol-1-phosphate dehydrogenase [NAD(P)+]
MQICGSSRPASGSEHLLSHALDNLAEERNERPKPHGLQCGVATYIVTRLQNQGSDRIGKLFEDTGFWECIRKQPFSKKDWLEAAKEAPGVKAGFYTVLSSRDCTGEISEIIETDPLLKGCFV